MSNKNFKGKGEKREGKKETNKAPLVSNRYTNATSTGR
jgi:hypothetical protein